MQAGKDQRDRLRGLARSSVAIRSGGIRFRKSNGRGSALADSRPRRSAARSGPSARSITSRAKSTPPLTPAVAPVTVASSLKIDSAVSAPTEFSLAISIDRPSISSSPIRAITLAARSDPSAASNTAALRAPDRRSMGEPAAPAGYPCEKTRRSPGSALLHPGAKLLGDSIRVAVGQLFNLPAQGIAVPVRVAEPLPLVAPFVDAAAAIAGAGLGWVSRSSSDRRTGASSSRSQRGSWSISSCSRLRSERVVKNRKMMAPMPSSAYLA